MASLRFAGRWHDAVSDEDPQACSGLFRTRPLGGYVAKELGVPEKTGEMGVFLSSAWKTGVSQGKSQNIFLYEDQG